MSWISNKEPGPQKIKKNQLQHTGVHAGIRPAHSAQMVLKVTFSPYEIGHYYRLELNIGLRNDPRVYETCEDGK